MNRSLPLIDQEITASRADLARDLIRLIGIKSDQGEPRPGAPFGNGPKAMLDEVLRMGKEAGFYTADYGCGVVSLALKPGQPDLGIWLHGDVVPAGEGWNYPPYQGTPYENCIIGRGATDNKGQLCAIFHLMKILKKLGLELGYNVALYCGSNEENGKKDAKAFCAANTPPRLSLVPDASFPVGYGGKGGLFLTFRAKEPLTDITITAGQDAAPFRADAVAFGETLATQSMPRHLAYPDPNGNMITRMAERLLADPRTADRDRPVLEFFRILSTDIHGDAFGLNVPVAEMSPLVVAAKRIDTDAGRPALQTQFRYPIELTAEQILETMSAAAEKHGLEISAVDRYMEPYLLDKNWSVVQTLARIANEITGDNKPPYTVGGGTYAHELPNALAFGMDGCCPPADFPKGQGGAHGLDELVSLDRLERAMKIYARSLLALDDMDW